MSQQLHNNHLAASASEMEATSSNGLLEQLSVLDQREICGSPGMRAAAETSETFASDDKTPLHPRKTSMLEDAHSVNVTAAVTFESLPAEVLFEIVGYLCAGNLEHYKADELIDAPNQTYHSTLSHLCLVSKQMAAIARPLLYQTIFVFDTGTLVYLFRTVSRYHILAEHVKQLVLSIPFDHKGQHHQGPDLNLIYPWKRLDLGGDWKSPFPHHKRGVRRHWEQLCDLYVEVMRRCINLQYIGLKDVGRVRYHRPTPADYLASRVESVFSYSSNLSPSVSAGATHTLRTPFLPRLTTFCMFPGEDPEFPDRNEAATLLGTFVWLPSLRKLVCYRKGKMFRDLPWSSMQPPKTCMASGSEY